MPTSVQGNLIPQGELKGPGCRDPAERQQHVQGNLIPQGELKAFIGTPMKPPLTVQGNLIPQGELKVPFVPCAHMHACPRPRKSNSPRGIERKLRYRTARLRRLQSKEI